MSEGGYILRFCFNSNCFRFRPKCHSCGFCVEEAEDGKGNLLRKEREGNGIWGRDGREGSAPEVEKRAGEGDRLDRGMIGG